MNIALWITSGLLAAAYLAVGGMKIVLSTKQLADNPNLAAIAEELSPPAIKTIGGLEVAGALGLILPWLTGIATVLTPVAALGLVVLQIGAMVFHGRRREFKQWPVNLLFAALAAFVAWGRLTGVGG
jgi:DoxX-like family